MFGVLELFNMPPSWIGGIILILVAVLYGTQAKLKLRPYLLAAQVSIFALIISTIIDTLIAPDYFVGKIMTVLLSQTLGTLLGFAIIGWLIIKICFIIRFRNDQSKIFSRNRRS